MIGVETSNFAFSCPIKDDLILPYCMSTIDVIIDYGASNEFTFFENSSQIIFFNQKLFVYLIEDENIFTKCLRIPMGTGF